MRKGLMLFCLVTLLLSACGGAPSPQRPPAYHVSLNKDGVVVMARNYVGYLVKGDGSKIGMKLDDVVENMATGGFDANFTLDTVCTDLPIEGVITPYVDGKKTQNDPFLTDFTYLGVFWMFIGTPDLHTGVITGITTQPGMETTVPWTLAPV